MNQDLLQKAEKLNKARESRSRMNRATRILSLVIALATVYALMLPAVTMNNEPVCGFEEHVHTEACYDYRSELICEQEEAEGHTHTEECYTLTEEYVCGLEEIETHVHTDECYAEQPVLNCALEESEEHTHNDECYVPEKVLICTLSTEGHVHGPECIVQTKTLTCTIEESEGHTHSETCYEEQPILVCGLEEHVHTDECYPEASDDMADVETKELWEASLAGVELTDDWARNVLAVAASQLGYTESSANFRYVGSEKKGYSRYGAWYGDPYGDWCAMFVSFCLHYGGVPKQLFPSHCTCNFWTELLHELGRFVPAQGAVPRPGDVVFFDTKEHFSTAEPRSANHVGLVFNVTEEKLYTIEGNINNSVVPREYDWNDPTLFGYGLLPEKPVQPESENELTGGEETDPEEPEDADIPEDTGHIDNAEDPEEDIGETGETAEGENENLNGNLNENNIELPAAKTRDTSGEKLLAAAMDVCDAAAGIAPDGMEGDAKAFFVTACVGLAELNDTVPCFENCAQWAYELAQRGLLTAPDGGAVPAPGDLVLLDMDGDSLADAIGIVTDADSESGELVTLESDAAARVSYHFYKLSDACILGFYSVAGNVTVTEEKEAPEDAENIEETEEKEETSVSAVSEDGVTVTVTGQLPENAQVVLTPVSEEVLAEIMADLEADTPLFAYDITIVDAEGQEWQPGEIGAAVSISGLTIPEDSETEVVHIPDEGEPVLVESETVGDTVEIAADGFSIYVVYSIGKAADTEEITTLTYTSEDSAILASLTISPKLEDETDISFRMEMIDKTAAPELWGSMAAPVLAIIEEEESSSEATEAVEGTEGAEKTEEKSPRIYAVKIMKGEAEYTLGEGHAVKLEATLNETAEEGKSLRVFALNQQKAPAEAGSTEEPGTSEGTDSAHTGSAAFTASNLGTYEANTDKNFTVNYEGTGIPDGFAMLFVDPEEAPEEPSTRTVAPNVTITKDIAYHKQIDYLGDDTPENTDDDEKYRLYLDAGPLQYSDPMDLLIVVDRFQSMSNDFSGISRGAAVTKILNGAVDSAADDGLISRFLSLHKDNEAAVIAFFGDGANESFNSDGVTTDTAELLEWTNKENWDKRSTKYINCQYVSEGTSGKDYCAAYLKMASMLNRTGGNEKKMVIFLSDGVPTYYLADREGGGYNRLGTGESSEAENVSACEAGTKTFFDEAFGALAPIHTVAIGSGTDSFSTDVLQYMSADNTVRTAADEDGLKKAFEEIIYGSEVTLSDITITDTLSNYVDMVGRIKLVRSKDGTETTIYERAAIGITAFEDTADSHELISTFDPSVQSVKYDPETKEITAALRAEDGLDASSQYTLSFEVETNATASVSYMVNRNYTDKGDTDTDRGENETSSGQDGYPSNKEAKLTYTLNGVPKTENYPKPVVQVAESSGKSSKYTVNGFITQHKTIDWLGDKSRTQNNPDTDLDDGTSTPETLKDHYRLYLDTGQYEMSEPLDLLIVLDKSNSMILDEYKDVIDSKGKNNYRYVAIDEIVNGVNGEEGFIETFLKLNPDNHYAVVSFGGGVGSAGSDTVKKGNSIYRPYTSDTKFETDGWRRTYQKVDCTPNNGSEQWGTNYSAALYRAQDMLAKSTTGNRKVMVFISDGVPTFWMENINYRYGNGGETKNEWGYNGSYDTNSYYSTGVSTRDQNIAVTKERIDDLHDHYPDMGIYVIGVASKEKLDTTLLNYMATENEAGVYTSLNYSALMEAFESILYGNMGDFKALGIQDTLSDYVDLYSENADIKVTFTDKGISRTLYQRGQITEAEGFTDVPGTSENFTADNKQDNKPLLSSVSYDTETKTITAQFNPELKLSRSAKYEVSFNVKTTQQAKDEYAANILAGNDPYGGVRGDADSDFSTSSYANASSSGKPGFHSNTAATAGYKVGETPFIIPYDHPVVQTGSSVLNITVTKLWDDSITNAGKKAITVKLYSSTDGKNLAPVMNTSVTPAAAYELEIDAAHGWKATAEGLPFTDSEGAELSYYILEDNPALNGYLAVYYDPVYNVTIGGATETVVGRVNIPESSASSIYVGTATVRNDPALLLPDTGGSGDTLSTNLGTMILALGLMLLLKKSRDEKYPLRMGRKT